MFQRLSEWFEHRWYNQANNFSLAQDYFVVFSSEAGRRVLQHLLDEVYCSVYEGSDPSMALVHNARRSVIEEILRNIDAGQNPSKYHTDVVSEAIQTAGGR